MISLLASAFRPCRTTVPVLLFVISMARAGGIGSMATAQAPGGNQPEVERTEPISTFIRRIHKDRRGHYWFGTNGDGVLRWNGTKLEGFAIREGFGGVAVRGIVEDEKGHVWFGTERGLTRYDGSSFVNFTKADGLVGDDVWALMIDRKGCLLYTSDAADE